MKLKIAAVLIAIFACLSGLAPVLSAAPRTRTPRRATQNARVVRSRAVRQAFAKLSGYPRGRPGYIVDHIIPLACGGLDEPSNMQWQSVADAKAKDKIERKDCRK